MVLTVEARGRARAIDPWRIEWPTPPSLAVDEDAPCREEALLTMRDDTHLAGTVRAFDLCGGRLALLPQDMTVVHTIPFGVVRAVFLRRPVRSKSGTAPRRSVLRFRDGSHTVCDVVSRLACAEGTFLYLADTADRLLRAFVPADVFESCDPVKPLGEALVARGSATHEGVAAAVERQRELRHRPLGHYLERDGLASPAQIRAALERQKTLRHLRLGDALVMERIITPEQRDAALAAQKADRSKPLGDVLIEMGAADTQAVQHALVAQLGYPFVALARFPVEPDAVRCLPAGLAHRFQAMPLYCSATRIAIAVETPLHPHALQQCEFMTGLRVETVIADAREIRAAVARHYPI